MMTWLKRHEKFSRKLLLYSAVAYATFIGYIIKNDIPDYVRNFGLIALSALLVLSWWVVFSLNCDQIDETYKKVVKHDDDERSS